MTFDLRSALPFLLPKAISWAQEREIEILRTGIPLTEYGLSVAKLVGISEPEKVRISIVDGQLPLPSDLELREAGLAINYQIIIATSQIAPSVDVEEYVAGRIFSEDQRSLRIA